MGFAVGTAVAALRANGGQLVAALDHLLAASYAGQQGAGRPAETGCAPERERLPSYKFVAKTIGHGHRPAPSSDNPFGLLAAHVDSWGRSSAP